MQMTMDRYEADWAMVERGWQHHVLGKGEAFSSASEATKKNPKLSDQYLPGFVIKENMKALGPMEDGDVVFAFNFRGDRMLELVKAFEEDDFTILSAKKGLRSFCWDASTIQSLEVLKTFLFLRHRLKILFQST